MMNSEITMVRLYPTSSISLPLGTEKTRYAKNQDVVIRFDQAWLRWKISSSLADRLLFRFVRKPKIQNRPVTMMNGPR